MQIWTENMRTHIFTFRTVKTPRSNLGSKGHGKVTGSTWGEILGSITLPSSADGSFTANFPYIRVTSVGSLN